MATVSLKNNFRLLYDTEVNYYQVNYVVIPMIQFKQANYNKYPQTQEKLILKKIHTVYR